MLLAEWARRGNGRRVADWTIRVVARLCGLAFDVRGADRLSDQGSYVFVPNHTSPLDIPALLVACPGMRFVAAADLFRNPVLAFLMHALDTVPIDRENPRVARRQIQELSASKDRMCLAIFAEGRIAAPEEKVPFKSGAFVVAIATGASVVPVAIRGAGQLLPPGRALAVRPGTVSVEFLEPIPTEQLTVRDRKSLRDQARRAVAHGLESAPE
ncbi:MAG TPA: lysophospholipid acyltransferase family protein [Acidimicrobiales bacterium]|nr:lysophospholipid acyltransferase family protein [Acidimicrobiales bacterium]